MKLWKSYTAFIRRNCASPHDSVHDLAYWRNDLFASIIIYILPFCLIALIPALYFTIVVLKLYAVAIIDLVTITGVAFTAFLPGIPVGIRKVILITCNYLFACMLMYYVGINGGAFIFMQSAGIFFILIFPPRYAYWPVYVDLLIGAVFAICLHLNWLPWPKDPQHSIGAWITVMSNLIFLTLLKSALIPRLFNGLQQTLNNEKQLQLRLQEKQISLQQTMSKLELKNKEMEQFAYVASHDLQEPLRMITSFLANLENRYTDIIDDRGKQYIHFAVDGAQRMRQLILDLLEFSRVGLQEENKTEVKLSELISEIEILYQKQLEEKDGLLIRDNLPVILHYKTPLRQLLQNLISNALKYSKEGRAPRIEIKVTEQDASWKFIVADNGIGIKREYFERIFIIFQRLHNKSEYTGTGIGLAVCKKLVETLGGEIGVSSEVGNGSSFYFTIPKI